MRGDTLFQGSTIALCLLFVMSFGLTACAKSKSVTPTHLDLPAGVVLGQDFASAKQPVLSLCESHDHETYLGADAAPAKEQQDLIRCRHIDFMGAPREVEFMFNDGQLSWIWVLVESRELEKLGTTLADIYGGAKGERGIYTLFGNPSVALRQSPAEILFATPEMLEAISNLP